MATPVLHPPPVNPSKNEKYYRLVALLSDAVRPAFLAVLHKNNVLPSDPAMLFKELSTTHKEVLKKLRKDKVINNSQYVLLLPADGLTHSRYFDITLISVLIRHCLKLQAPHTSPNWADAPLQSHDQSIAAWIIRGRVLRNRIIHAIPDQINLTFQNYWSEGEKVVKGLKYPCDLRHLLKAPLDPQTHADYVKLIEWRQELGEHDQKLDEHDKKHGEHDKKFEELNEKLEELSENLEDLSKKLVEQSKEILRLSPISKDFPRSPNSEFPEDTKESDALESNIQKKQPYLHWKFNNNLCYLFEFNENVEEVIQEKVLIYSKRDSSWQDVVEPYQITKHNFSSMRFGSISGLTKSDLYRIEVTVKSGTSSWKIEIYEAVGTQDVTHRVGRKGLKVILHDEGGLAKALASDFYTTNNPKSIQVFVGAGEPPKTLSTANDWINFCQSNLNSYFDFEDKTEVVGQPDEWETLVMKNWKRCFNLRDRLDFVDKYESWKETFVSELKKHFTKLFVFENYDFLKHFELFGYSKDELGLDGARSDHDKNKNMVVFIPNKDTVLIIGIIDSSVEENEKVLFKLSKEMHNISNDIKMFVTLHSKILANGDLTIIRLLAMPNINESEFKDISEIYPSFPSCNECNSYILYKDQLTSSGQSFIREWWKSHIRKLQLHMNKQQSTKDRTSQHMQKLLAHTVGFMATTDICCMPGVFDDDGKVVRKLSLSKVQNEVMSIPDKHVFIKGGYGTGKSLILQLKLFHLVETLKGKQKIYFLCHDTSSLFLRQMKEVGKKMSEKIGQERKDIEIITENFDGLAARFKMESIDIVRFLRKISQENGTHAIIDEYNGICLMKKNAEEMKNILQQTNMKDSYLWIAVKPLSKHRTRVRYRMNTTHSDGYQFSDTGMKIKPLRETFRCTKTIYNILKETKVYIEGFSSKCVYPDYVHLATLRHGRTVESLRGDINTHSVKSLSYMDVRGIGVDFTPPSEQNDSVSKLADIKTTSLSKETETVEKPELSKGCQKEKYADEEDHTFKAYDNIDGEGNSSVTTSFKFDGKSVCGTQVPGKKPMFIPPFKIDGFSDINYETLIRAYVALIHIVELEKGGVLIICTDILEAIICVTALKLAKFRGELQNYICYMPKFLPNIASTDKWDKGDIIITDIEGVSGLEFDKVVVTLSSDEYFLSYSYVRSLSRCQSKLYFLEFPPTKPNRKSFTADIIKMWKDRNLVQQCLLRMDNCKCQEEDIIEPYICGKELEVEETVTYNLCRHEEAEHIMLAKYDGLTHDENNAFKASLYGKNQAQLKDILHDQIKKRDTDENEVEIHSHPLKLCQRDEWKCDRCHHECYGFNSYRCAECNFGVCETCAIVLLHDGRQEFVVGETQSTEDMYYHTSTPKGKSFLSKLLKPKETQVSTTFVEPCPWYHGKIDQDQNIEELLRNKGDFLVHRKTECFCLTLRWGTLVHISLKPEEGGVYRLPDNSESGSVTFTDIPHLITYHYTKKLPIYPDTDVKLLTPIIANNLEQIPNFKTGRVIKKGRFFNVYRGILPHGNLVAVKYLRSRLMEKPEQRTAEKQLRNEVEIMRPLNHRNILSLVGYSHTTERLYLLLKRCEKKDLQEVLRLEKANINPRRSQQMSLDIAEGMAYLEGMRLIHRDLSAKSCLVTKDYLIKISNFEMARKADINDEFISEDDDKSSTEWSALEILQHCISSSKSDVWSYGVVLWEIIWKDKTPYADRQQEDLKEILAGGYRLQAPNSTPRPVVELMTECWCEYPRDRPSFNEIVNKLKMIKFEG